MTAPSRAPLLILLVWTFASTALAQAPEERGALTDAEWDAGRVDAAGTMIPTRVLYPTEAGAYPLVAVIHGAGRTGARQIVLAQTLASRGFVVVLPDMPCNLTSCDHAANARQISALLEWAVAQSGMTGSMIEGRVDGSRRGLIGHSWGGLAAHLAAASDDTIDSVVLFDPNDDGTEGVDATSGITAPTLQVLAAVPGLCNGAWAEAEVTPMLPDPALQLTVSGSGHCDPEEPGEPLCAFGCGAGDASLSTIFRRYAVAWTTCNLAADSSVAPWLGGASMSADETGGVIEGVVASGLDSLACRAISPPVDAGPAGSDGGVEIDSGVTPGTDGGARDGGPITTSDAGTDPGEGDGCGCRAARRGPGTAWIALFLAAILGARRRGAKTRRHGDT